MGRSLLASGAMARRGQDGRVRPQSAVDRETRAKAAASNPACRRAGNQPHTPMPGTVPEEPSAPAGPFRFSSAPCICSASTIAPIPPQHRPMSTLGHMNFEKRCSDACTRAGIAALVLAAVAFALVAPLRGLNRLDALAEYATHRMQLKVAVDDFFSTPIWAALEKADNGGNPKYWRIEKVAAECDKIYNAMQPPDLPPTIKLPFAPPVELDAPKNSPPSNVVTAIFVVPGLSGWFGDAIKAVKTLDDGRLGSKAADYSNAIRVSIIRWQTILDRCRSYETTESGQQIRRKSYAYPLSDPARMLTLRDLELLANSEPVDPSFFDKESSSYQIAVPWIPEKVGVWEATVLTGVSLCVVIIYFWLFARHAALSASFPKSGTLFGAINQDRIGKLVFTGIAMAPSIALLSQYAADDDKPWAILATLIVVLAFSVDIIQRCIFPFSRMTSNPETAKSE